jgi:Phosphoesterase family
VLNGIARDFGVFDHWFCEVPSQTFMNRSFWTAATSSGFVVNSPMKKWFTGNDAETIFERLEAHGRTWKVYVMEPMPVSFTGVIHFPRLRDRLASHFVPFAEFEEDAAAGTLPDFSLIEPNMLGGHGDYHPAFGRSFRPRWTWRWTTRPRCSRARRSWSGCSLPTAPPPPRPVQTSGTPRCSSGGTSPAAPTTTSRPRRCRRPTRPLRLASSASPSTVPGTGCRPSSCRRGSNRGRYTTRSTATPR